MLGWFVCPTVSMVTTSKPSGLEKTLFTVVTTQPEFTVRFVVGGQTENTVRVVFSIVAPTCQNSVNSMMP